jgi:hypothetical protein
MVAAVGRAEAVAFCPCMRIFWSSYSHANDVGLSPVLQGQLKVLETVSTKGDLCAS